MDDDLTYLLDLVLKQHKYLILGMIDGCLVILGIVIGAYASGMSVDIIVKVGMGGAIASGMSNAFSALVAERAETRKELAEIEEKMLHPLTGTEIAKKKRLEVYARTVMHGSSAFIGAMTPLIPFIFVPSHAFFASIGLSISILFLLGIYLGSVLKTNRIISGIKLILLGLVIVLICHVLGG